MTRTSGASSVQLQLNVQDLLDRARAKAGLSNFGDGWFLQPLEALVRFINKEGGLHTLECRPVEGLVDNLVLRLRLQDFVERNPAVTNENIDVAAIIVGQSRGGSTFLHRLLTASPQVTATYTWELQVPVGGDGMTKQERIAIGQQWIDALYAEIPEMRAVHPLDVNAYDEEILLMESSFLNVLNFFYFNIPEYRLWLIDQDHTKVYEELLLWLQVLQFQDPERRTKRWILKSPQHLLGGNLPTMMRVFPEAHVLMTHRDMKKVVGSNCQSSRVAITPYSDAFSATETGPQFVELFHKVFSVFEDARASSAPGKFIDVAYENIMKLPLEVFRDVLTKLGFTLTDEDVAAAQGWVDANPRTTHPANEYKLEDFGLTGPEIDASFAAYSAKYL